MVTQDKQHLDIMEKAAELAAREFEQSMRADDQVNMAAGAGTNDLVFETVKPGRVLIITHISGYNDTNSPTRIRVGYNNGSANIWLKTTSAPLVSETVGMDCILRLRDGMYPIVRFEGCTAGDDLYAALNGYWIRIK